MKNKLFVLTIVVIVVGIFLFLLQNHKSGLLVSSSINKTGAAVVTSPTPIPSSVPKTFQFDSSTDLKKELDSINPQVLDSDFE